RRAAMKLRYKRTLVPGILAAITLLPASTKAWAEPPISYNDAWGDTFKDCKNFVLISNSGDPYRVRATASISCGGPHAVLAIYVTVKGPHHFGTSGAACPVDHSCLSDPHYAPYRSGHWCATAWSAVFGFSS